MDLQAMMLDAARWVPTRATTPTSASQGQPRPRPRSQQLGVGDRRRCLPPRPPPSRGETHIGGVGKEDEARGTRDTCHGSGEATPVAAAAAGDAAAPGVAMARADSDNGKGGAELGDKRRLDLAEEKGGGGAGSKRGLAWAVYPPPKRRLVSCKRRFPPGCGRDAAADDNSGLVVARADYGASDSDALRKTAPPLSIGKAGSSASAEVVSAPIADSCHHGLEAELQRSSEPLCQSSVPSTDGLRDTDSQGDAKSAGFVRKELVPAARRLLPKPMKVSAVRRFPPGCGRAGASLVAGGRSSEVVVLPLPEKVVATDCSPSAPDKQAMQITAVPCNATITDRAAQKEEFVEGEIAASKVQPQGSQRCTNVTLHESSACRDVPSVPSVSLPSLEKKPSCVTAKDIKVVIKSAGSSSNALAQSLSKGPSKEHMVSAKMGRTFSGVAQVASGQGAMRRDKVILAAQKEVRPAKLIQKFAQPLPFSKVKVKETEHGKHVTTNGFEDTAGFAKHQVVQDPTFGKKCLQKDSVIP